MEIADGAPASDPLGIFSFLAVSRRVDPFEQRLKDIQHVAGVLCDSACNDNRLTVIRQLTQLDLTTEAEFRIAIYPFAHRTLEEIAHSSAILEMLRIWQKLVDQKNTLTADTPFTRAFEAVSVEIFRAGMTPNSLLFADALARRCLLGEAMANSVLEQVVGTEAEVRQAYRAPSHARLPSNAAVQYALGLLVTIERHAHERRRAAKLNRVWVHRLSLLLSGTIVQTPPIDHYSDETWVRVQNAVCRCLHAESFRSSGSSV